MRSHFVTGFTLSAALVLSAGCIAADQPGAQAEAPSKVAPSPAVPAPKYPVRDEETKEKDKRGNTPPGMDRTGAGPAEGAILDPTGAVTKKPVLRER
jgi:hypothetical protein